MTNGKDTLKEAVFSDDKTKEKLLEIKENIIKEYIDSIKKNNQEIKDIETPLKKYLINSGSIEDVFQDIFRGSLLSILLPESIDNLNKVKEKLSSIQNIPTSKELSTLKSEILNLPLYFERNPRENSATSQSQQTNQRHQRTQGSTQDITQATINALSQRTQGTTQDITQATINALSQRTQGTTQNTAQSTTNRPIRQTIEHNQTNNSPEIVDQQNKFIESVYKRAAQQIGKPYSRGGISTSTGFDCSGLRYRAFKEEGIRFSQRLTAQGFSDADVDLRKDQVKPGDFMFWDQKPGKKKHNPIYHIEMIISKPYTKNGKTYVRTLGSSTDAKDDRRNYVGEGVQIREREMKDYRHYGRPTYYYQLAQYERTGSSDILIAGSNRPSQNLENQILSS